MAESDNKTKKIEKIQSYARMNGPRTTILLECFRPLTQSINSICDFCIIKCYDIITVLPRIHPILLYSMHSTYVKEWGALVGVINEYKNQNFFASFLRCGYMWGRVGKHHLSICIPPGGKDCIFIHIWILITL